MSESVSTRKPSPQREIVCSWCGNTFMSRGPRAMFCSSSCREKNRYRKDRQRRLLSSRQYRQDNTDKIKNARRERYRDNKDKYRRQNRENYEKHRDKRIAYALEYQRKNPHVVAATRTRRASSKSFVVTGRDLLSLIQRQKNRCAYCGCVMSPPGRDMPTSLQWDHVVPLKRGGAHSIGNIVAACRTCNIRKSSMLLMEWRISNSFC